jgi:hypothetical protein
MRCGWRFGKSFLRAGLGVGHLTEGRSGQPARDRRLDASPAVKPERQEHEAEDSHQREQEALRAVPARPVGFRDGGGRLRGRPPVLANGPGGDGRGPRCGRRPDTESHRRGLRARQGASCRPHRVSLLGTTRSRLCRLDGERTDNGSRTRLPARTTTCARRRSFRLHGRELSFERLRRRRNRRLLRLGRPRPWLTDRPRWEQGERVEIPMRIGG